MTSPYLPALLTVLVAASPSAQACGGFFCSQSQPVIQNAERIVFAMDGEDIETHVQIFYEGPSEEFAWIVPVPTVPETFLSTDSLFNTLAFQTGPVFSLNIVDEGKCREGNLFRGNLEFALDSGVALSDDGVDVVDLKQVGPYDTAVLQAADTSELMAWLGDNGYDLPQGVEDLLTPYAADGAYFLALKLSKNKDTGDIAPIGFRYSSTKVAIPIQLTSVAAAPDMRVETYVFGEHRVVPESYLHVKINDAAVNWWNGGQNYAKVITKAANEAGGHAFATDFAGSPEFMIGQLWSEGRLDQDQLETSTNAASWLDEVRFQIPVNNTLLDVIETHIDLPAGVDPADFYNCPDCYDGWKNQPFDGVAATADLWEFVVEPLQTAEALFEHPTLSRMTSSLDAVEMTVDPVFVQNPDMGDVSQTHQATLVYECNGRKRDKARRRLELTDGRAISLPSENWFAKNDTTEFAFIKELGGINAQIIEKTGASGQPEIIDDYTGYLAQQTDEFNQSVRSMLGCGCASTGGPSGGFFGLVLAALCLRRRRTA